MFGEFHGLPVHALVVHAAVLFAPLAALVGLAFVIPRWRPLLRWPLVVVAALATATIFVAKESGERLRSALKDQITGNITGEVVARHAQLAQRLFLALILLLAVSVLAAVLHPGSGSKNSRTAPWKRSKVLQPIGSGGAVPLGETEEAVDGGSSAVAGASPVRAPAANGWLRRVAAVLVAVVAVAVLVLTYQTGEAGAKAAWNPSGTVDYSGK